MEDAEEDNTKENGEWNGLTKSLEAFENLTKFFACVKCDTVPSAKDKLYTLGNCCHKYCRACAEDFAGTAQLCVAPACLMIGNAVEEDSFSSSVLDGLGKLKGELQKIPRIAPFATRDNDSDLMTTRTKRTTKTKNTPTKRATKTSITEQSPPVAKRARSLSPDMGDLFTIKPKATKLPTGRNTTSKELTRTLMMEPILWKRGITTNDSPDITDFPISKRALAYKRRTVSTSTTTSELAKPSGLQNLGSAKWDGMSHDMGDVVVDASELPSTPKKSPKKKGRPKSKNSGIKMIKSKSTESTSSSSTVASGSGNASFTPSKLFKQNPKGETLLHIACRKGEVDKVQQLILAGADPNLQDFAGWTPLHEAVSGKASPSSKLDLVKLLFEHGSWSCNPNIPGMDNETVLHDAARRDLSDIIVYLLEKGASPNIRNNDHKLPREIAATEEIEKLLAEASKFSNESLVDDAAVLAVQLSTAVVHFQKSVSSDLHSKTEQILKLNVSEALREGITHIIFPSDGSGEVEKVALSLEYLFGIATGAWMLNARWITKSLAAKKVLSPLGFEIFGCVLDPERITAPVRLARLNREIGNPGLLSGFCFNFYKNTAFRNMERKDLVAVVNLAGGLVLGLSPNPNDVDPLEFPVRFHAKQDSNKLVLTSHIILYDDQNKPPSTKMYNMEHIKVLKVQWLIDSVIHFKLLDPDGYL